MSKKDLVYLSLITLLTSVLWLLFDSYHSYITSTLPPETKYAAEGLNPKLNITFLKNFMEAKTAK